MTPPSRKKRAGGLAAAVFAAAFAVTALLALRAAAAPDAPGGAAIFAPGVVSTFEDEIGVTFSPDGKTAFFARRSPTTSTSPVMAIFATRMEGGGWSQPEIVPFSGRYNDFAPSLSPDGSRLYFSSLRPRAGGEAIRKDADIWVVERSGPGAWNPPHNLGVSVNTDSNDAYASQAADGTLYFASDREGGAGGSDLYRAAWRGSSFAAPESLGPSINTPGYESQPAIAADQSFLVFTSVGRPNNKLTGGSPYPRGDLYASVRSSGVFQAGRNLGPAVNTTATESSATLAPDGKRLFFVSERGFPTLPMPAGLTRERFEESMRGILNGRGNIYEVSLKKAGLPAGGGR